MEILTSLWRLYISFKSPVNDSVYSFGHAALLLLVEVQNHTVPVRERRRIRVKLIKIISLRFAYEKFTRRKRKSILSECQSKIFPGQLRELISLRLEFQCIVSFQVGLTSTFCPFFSRNVKKSYSKLFMKQYRNTGIVCTWDVSEVLYS